MNIRPSQLFLLATLLIVLRNVLHGRSFEWRRMEYLLLTIFLGLNVVSLLNAENFSRSFTVLLYTIFTATLVVVLPILLRKKEELLVLRNVILVSAAAVGLFGLWQFLSDMIGLPTSLTGLRPQYTKSILGFTRIQSTAIEPLYFANYLLLPLGLLISMILDGRSVSSSGLPVCPLRVTGGSVKNSIQISDQVGNDKVGFENEKKWRISLYALLALLLVNFLLTSSRGGYLAFLAMAGVIVWMYREKVLALKRFFFIGLAGLMLAFITIQALAVYDVTTPDSLASTFMEHITTVTSGAAYEERVETFERSLQAFETHPFIGVGVGGYGPYSATFPEQEPEIGWAIVNNEPLELLAETGILGVGAMLAFLIYVLYLGAKRLPPALRELEPVRIGAFAALIGIIVQYQTFSTLYIVHVWFSIGLLIAISSLSKLDK